MICFCFVLFVCFLFFTVVGCGEFTQKHYIYQILSGLFKGKKRRKSQPDSDDASTKWNMDYLVNYGTYVCVGWMAISGVPLLSYSIGLML